MNVAMDFKARHAQLVGVISMADKEYHVIGVPTMSDAEYDAMKRELVALEAAHPELAKTSPSSNVGASSPGAKVKHRRPMLSLDNVFTPEEANSFFKTSAPKVWEPKIDGLSCSLIYENGKLVRAVTRGDGVEGDDVTANAMVISSIPKSLNLAIGLVFAGSLEVRGEVVIMKSDFEQLVKEMVTEGDEPFANARNAAAGSLKLKDTAECATRRLSFIAYQSFGSTTNTHVEMIEELRRLGFNAPWSYSGSPTSQLVFSDITSDTIAIIDFSRKQLPFETDGAVIKINDFKTRDEMGLGRKSPKWAVAYKFAPEEGISVLEEVTLQVGRTGVLTPVAGLSPVLLNGATVRRASLCNFDEITRLDVAVGDEVVVVRAAEVIPKVIRVFKKGANRREIQTPTACPACGTAVVKDPALVAIRCTNFNCVEQVFQRLSHAVNKSSLDWDGCGDAQLSWLMGKGKCVTLSDLFALADVTFLCSKAAEAKFLSERERVKTAPLWRKLHALGIEGIGRSFCKDLALKYGSLLAILDDKPGVTNIVGPSRVNRFFNEIGRLADEIQRLDSFGFKFEEQRSETPVTKATGKSFVITGSLMTGSREQVAARIEAAGGVVKSSVGKSTDYLVVGEAPGGNKTRAAEKHGTKVLSEDELYALLGVDASNLPDDPLARVDMETL